MNNPIKHQEVKLAVMFADVVGSTQLFDKIGDEAAKIAIDQCLNTMIEIIVKNHGEIVKTIGDEVMCRFSNIDNAANSARVIQDRISEASGINRSTLKVRIGLHYGLAIVEKGDIFGDVVNVAARMSGIAQGQQIIVTEEVATNISPLSGIMTRLFDHVKIKGKQKAISIYEILWEQDDQTTMQLQGIPLSLKPANLILTYQKIEKTISNTRFSFSIGRDSGKDLFVNSTLTSRTHAIIEYHRGKFVLKDQSTNGTYVRDESGQEIYLRREELPLTGRGIISLGASIDNNSNHLIEYECP